MADVEKSEKMWKNTTDVAKVAVGDHNLKQCVTVSYIRK